MPDLPDTGLPVEAGVAAVRAALGTAGAAVLQAEPGAGKSTVMPLRLLGEHWLGDGRIVMLEPRRLATRATATRMAHLLGEEVGRTIGYRTRDERRVSRAMRVEVVTEGILTRRLQQDPSLPGTGLVIFDEVHERNLQSDLALALTLDVRSGLRPDLAVLAMSATLDTARLAGLLGDSEPAPVVTSAGRAHPVDVRWRPREARSSIGHAVAAAVTDALRTDPGDVLVFLPGAGEIRRTARDLAAAGLPPDVDVRPLFGALGPGEQDAALAPSPPGRRRVVLATDIAETSLTVAGVRVVVDAGEVRRPRHDRRSGLTRLHTSAAARSSADQRAGRAGRVQPGVAYRLWSPADHAHRPAYADPEIQTADLTGLALELAVWGAPPEALAFLDPPPPEHLAEASALLGRLGALDASGRPTTAGRAMLELPLHPRLAHMVTGSVDTGRGWLACVLAATLEDRDVLRGRPGELPADIGDRVQLVSEQGRSDPRADRSSLRTARRRARELAERTGVTPGSADLAECGRVLALAYPDRIAQARGDGRFRLRSGRGVAVGDHDPLRGEAFLVVAEVGPGPRGRDDDGVRLAAPLDPDAVEALAAADITEVTEPAWNAERDDLEVRRERRLDALVLASSTGPAPPGEDTTARLVDRVRTGRLDLLTWTPKARSLQERATFAHQALGDRWPDLSDEALLASLDEWLAPLLAGATRRADVERVDLLRALRQRLGYHLVAELDRVAPTSITVPSGRSVPIDYRGTAPGVAVRAQEMFGPGGHPTVLGGRVPLAVHLLSPAGRPVQVTADLPGFWAGSWAEVRKDMAGRYPKHDWPVDPTTAAPSTRTRRRR